VHVPLAIAIMALATWLCAHSWGQRGVGTSGATYPTAATAHDRSTARGATSHG
jgi:hypothetical protein